VFADTLAVDQELQAGRVGNSCRISIDTCIRYLAGHAAFLGYDQALKKGWPIATGVIEGACRHLIGDRLDITGARWGLAGAEAVLKLRALIANGDFPVYWNFHLHREHHRVHQARDQDRYALIA
jgi:hypothetical protein